MLGEVDVLAFWVTMRSASGKAEYGIANVLWAALRQLCEDAWQRGSGPRWCGTRGVFRCRKSSGYSSAATAIVGLAPARCGYMAHGAFTSMAMKSTRRRVIKACKTQGRLPLVSGFTA